MFSSCHLDLYSRRIRNLKGKTDLMGGIDLCLFGDFYQLSAVKQKGLYVSTNLKLMEAARGRAIWASDALRHYVELKKTHRFANDPAWGTLLERMRIGRPTVADLKLLNTRTVSFLKQKDASFRLPSKLTLVTPNNAERTALLRWQFRKFQQHMDCKSEVGPADGSCAWEQAKAIRIVAEVTFPNASDAISAHETKLRDYVRMMTSDKLNNLCGYLDLVVGSRVLLSKTILAKWGIVNNSAAIFVRPMLKSGVEPTLRTFADGVTVHAVDISNVLGVVLCHTHGNESSFVIPPTQKSSIPISWTHGRVSASTFRISIRQIPVIPAGAITGHKCQGQTCDSLLVASFGRYAKGADGWLYVALSRVRTMDGVFLAEPLSENPADFKQRHAVDAEMTRLRHMIEPTNKILTALFRG